MNDALLVGVLNRMTDLHEQIETLGPRDMVLIAEIGDLDPEGTQTLNLRLDSPMLGFQKSMNNKKLRDTAGPVGRRMGRLPRHGRVQDILPPMSI